ncbi:hypothetical protein OQA88_1407 [Cercophora sp. LCS_1]
MTKSFLTFTAWSKTSLGPIIGLKIGPTNLVVLNHPSPVRHLLQESSAALSARPKLPIVQKYIFPNDDDHPLWSNAEDHALMRRALIHHTSAVGITQAAPLLRAFAGRLAKDLGDGVDFNEALHTWAYDIALAVQFGKTTADMGPGWMLEYREVHRCFLRVVEPGVAQLAGIWPIVAWLPDWMAGGWKKDAEQARRGFDETYGLLVGDTKGTGGGGRFESMVSRYHRETEEKRKNGSKEGRLDKRGMELVAGSVLDASAGTVLSTMLFLVQALAKFPEVQRKAQAEVDEAWGRNGGLPGDIDTAQLPYVSACVLEVLRWRPPLPLSVPRMCLADQTVDGYRIPAGTTVVTNVWAIQHDPDAYDRPEEFEPERFLRHPLGKNGPVGENDGRKQPLPAFGTGRRACPGDQLALHQMGIAIAILLWAYGVVSEGEIDCSPETGILEGLAVTPSPFHVKFLPRDQGVEQSVLEEARRANVSLAMLLD